MSARHRGGRMRLLSVMLAGAGWCLLAEPARAELVCQTIQTVTPGAAGLSLSGLVQASDGNFYGTRPANSPGYGSVFRITPAGVFTTLMGPTGGDGGSDPEGGLVLATDGNFYGTTIAGGSYGRGTLFKLTPPLGFVHVIHAFNGTDGAQPIHSLIQGSDGFLYGVTLGVPTIFRATTAGEVTTLTNLTAAMHGYSPMPNDGLVQGPDGWLYGTTTMGYGSGDTIGSIYKISTNGLFQALAYFKDPSGMPMVGAGDHPLGGLAVGRDGFLYGTLGHSDFLPTTTNYGSVFRMTTNGVLTTLVNFAGTNGSNPKTRLLLAKDGNFYGLTTEGGPAGKGTIFSVTTNGVLTTLASSFGSDGVYSGPPPLIEASDGNFYGIVVNGGTSVTSFVFRLVPQPLITNATWSSGKLTLHWNSFTNGAYRLAYKSTLNEANWTTQYSTITATGANASASDYPGAATQRFYQIMLLP
jgi:uncharacterized repeat protein (TIGR03803 family)